MKYAVGVDVGGTKVSVMVVDESGGITVQTTMSTDLTVSPENMINRINESIRKVIRKANISESHIEGIGIGAPGPLDSRNGTLINPPNLHGWIDIPIQHIIEQALPYPVRLENDANVAALAEKWLGAGRGNDNFIYMTVSTGVGSGIISDGTLLRGRKGNAGDIGHAVVDPSFGKCSCGQYGCLEAIASGTEIAKRGSEILGRGVSTKEVFDAYEAGHSDITPYIERVLRALGVACVSLVNTFDTEKVVIGGGVSKVGDLLFEPIRDYVKQYALNPTGRETEIVPAELEQHAGAIGAAALWFNTSQG